METTMYVNSNEVVSMQQMKNIFADKVEVKVEGFAMSMLINSIGRLSLCAELAAVKHGMDKGDIEYARLYEECVRLLNLK